MKKLLLIFTLLFSTLLFSTPSYAEWTKVASIKNGADTFYVDFERIRKHGGYIYFWELTDYLKPEHGVLSAKVYREGDCKLFRLKSLSYSFHEEPMGGGTGQFDNRPDKDWSYPIPASSGETALKKVCSR